MCDYVSGHTACVELLLSYGMDADMELDEVGTPLYCACETRSTKCVQRLLILGQYTHTHLFTHTYTGMDS